MEFFVQYIQLHIPTIIIRFFIKLYLIITSKYSLNKHIVKELINTIDKSRTDKVTILTDKANEQHYEVPTTFFMLHLGPRLKYSSCEWKTNIFKENETLTLKSYQKRVSLDAVEKNGDILEMGSGWGSLSLYNAECYPQLNFISFSNSKTQVKYINQIASERGLNNLKAYVEDYADFCSNKSKFHGKKFDRIIAIETIEHSRNIECLFEYISMRMKDGAKMFIQSLVLQHHSYMIDDSDWMGRNFFSGGQMLAAQSYLHYNKHLIVTSIEPRTGKEYAKTLDYWLKQLEKQKTEIISLYGNELYEKFRMFYMQCTEAFDMKNGSVYMTCYYELEKR